MKDLYQVATINNDGKIKHVGDVVFYSEQEAIEYLKKTYDLRWNVFYPEPGGKMVVWRVQTVYEKLQPPSGSCRCKAYNDKHWPYQSAYKHVHSPEGCYTVVEQKVDIEPLW